jgi:hypothetical protein
MRSIAFAALISAVASPQSTQATTFTLTNGNSSTTITPSSPYGMTDWSVDGITQLYRQGFWFRSLPNKPEKGIGTIFSSAVQTGPNVLNTYYSGGTFNIEITYSLLGGAAGSGSSVIGENIRIINLASTALNFHFFQYVDLDLLGSHLGDTVWLEQDLNGMFNKAFQTKGNAYFGDEIVIPSANHGEVGLSQSILTKLDDILPTTLNDSVGPVTGDAVWAFQWDVIIPGNSYFDIAINKSVYVAPVPEPSTAAMVAVGVALVGLARRRFISAK